MNAITSPQLASASVDAYLQRTWPTVCMPRSGEIPPMDNYGERFILTADGLYMQVRRAWIEALVPLQEEPFLRKLPYGSIACGGVKLTCGPIPTQMLARFTEQARQALPNEAAAFLLWSSEHGWRYAEPERILSVSPGEISYTLPALGPNESLVLDIHSHGRSPAFFSATDEQDDLAGMKIVAVIGKVDPAGVEPPMLKMALRCLGMSFEIQKDGSVTLMKSSTLAARDPSILDNLLGRLNVIFEARS